MSTSSPDLRPLTRRASLLVVISSIALALYYVFIVTHGTMKLVGREPGWRLYPAMWQSLVQGRFDLDPNAVAVEAFHRDGKTYTYYGIFPAFLRGLSLVFVDSDHGGVSQASCALAALVIVIPFLWLGLRLDLHRDARRGWFALFAVALALGTPAIFGLALADIYDEAVLWGAAWAGEFNVMLLLFAAARPGSRTRSAAFGGMCITAGMALLSRATSGLCTGVELAGVCAWLLYDRRAVHAPVAGWPRAFVGGLAVYGSVLLFQGLINERRWGNPLEFRPIQLQEAFAGTERGRRAALHGLFSADRIPTSACFYFLPDTGSLKASWPFFTPSGRTCFGRDFPYADLADDWHVEGTDLQASVVPYFDLIDGPRMPLTLVSPALLLFSVLGLARTKFLTRPEWKDRAGILIALGAVIAGLVFLTLDTLALHYEIDFLPSLAGLGFIGVLRSSPAPAGDSRGRRAAIVVATALVGTSVLAAHVTMLYTKMIRKGVPMERGNMAKSLLGE